MSNLIYHHTDLDGWCSAAIVRRYIEQNEELLKEGMEFFPCNYDRPFPIERITENDVVYMVDFCPKDEDIFLQIINQAKDFIWVDHHKGPVEKYQHLQQKGLRAVTYPAACMLTWQYFFPDKSAPQAVELVSDYDTWTWFFGQKTEDFANGSILECMYPEERIWDDLLNLNSCPNERVIELCRAGYSYGRSEKIMNEKYLKAFSFEIELGDLRGIVINKGFVSSKIFDSLTEEYDIYLIFVYTGTGYRFSMSTKREDLPVNEIAKRFGGGGHPKCSGFTVDSLEKIGWKVLERRKTNEQVED